MRARGWRATGMARAANRGGDVTYDGRGSAAVDGRADGAGCAKRPAEVVASVQDATAAALRSIQDIVRR